MHTQVNTVGIFFLFFFLRPNLSSACLVLVSYGDLMLCLQLVCKDGSYAVCWIPVQLLSCKNNTLCFFCWSHGCFIPIFCIHASLSIQLCGVNLIFWLDKYMSIKSYSLFPNKEYCNIHRVFPDSKKLVHHPWSNEDEVYVFFNLFNFK